MEVEGKLEECSVMKAEHRQCFQEQRIINCAK